MLDGLERADRLPEIFSSASVESTLLQKCVIPKSEGGQFPDMSSAISYFRNAFDAGSSKKKGIIELKPGVDTVFDGIKVRREIYDSFLLVLDANNAPLDGVLLRAKIKYYPHLSGFWFWF